MPEVADKSAKLMIGASVYLGKDVGWGVYRELYQTVYAEEGERVLRPDGILLIIQTNAYADGEFICRYRKLTNDMGRQGWEQIDERVWQRRRADFHQVPFSHVLVYRPPSGTARRNDFNKHKGWFQGIWNFPQTKGGAHNAYPLELCRQIVEATTVEGDLIVDPFAGTGMLLGTAKRMGRVAVGYEIDKELIPVIKANGCKVVE